MSLKHRVNKLETASARSNGDRKPSLRDWLAEEMGVDVTDLDPRIQTLEQWLADDRESES